MDFNAREIASAIWSTVALLGALSVPDVRKAAMGVIRAALHWVIVLPVLVVAGYTIAAVLLLRAAGYWNAQLLKDTIYWFVLTGLAQALRPAIDPKKEVTVAEAVGDSVKVVVIFEFLVGTYVFSLPIELLLIPLVVIIAMLSAAAQSRPEYAGVGRYLVGIRTVLGLGVLIWALWRALADLRGLENWDTARQILLAPVLALFMIPVSYTFGLYVAYDSLFRRMHYWTTDEQRRALGHYRWRMFLRLGLSLGAVRACSVETAIEALGGRSRFGDNA